MLLETCVPETACEKVLHWAGNVMDYVMNSINLYYYFVPIPKRHHFSERMNCYAYFLNHEGKE